MACTRTALPLSCPIVLRDYIAPPTTCARLETIVSAAGGTLTTRPTVTRVIYPLPSGGDRGVSDFFRSSSVVDFEPDFIARLPQGRVFGEGIILSPDGRTIARDVSPDFGKSFAEHWLLTYRKMRPPTPISGATAVIATTLGSGYAHWLLEELPRWLTLPRGSARRMITHANRTFSREALASSGFEGEIWEAKRYAHFIGEELVIPSFVGRAGFPTPAGVRLLRDFATPFLGGESPFGERLYISRAKARRRRVSNEKELEVLLKSRGFVTLELESLSWQQQVAAFSRARTIVGPHGAGLANLVFCEPGTRVVECFHRAYVDGGFWRLAAVNGLDYRPVVATGTQPLALEVRANRQDMVVNLPAVMTACRD